jgi:hypothetical protein
VGVEVWECGSVGGWEGGGVGVRAEGGGVPGCVVSVGIGECVAVKAGTSVSAGGNAGVWVDRKAGELV